MRRRKEVLRRRTPSDVSITSLSPVFCCAIVFAQAETMSKETAPDAPTTNNAALTPFCDRACRITFEQNDGTPLYERLQEQLLIDERAKALRRKLGFGPDSKATPNADVDANECCDRAVCEGGSGGSCNPPQTETPPPKEKKTMTTTAATREEDSELWLGTERFVV